MHRLFRQFSSPGGIPSHVSVTTPGSIHEGGELGYVLVHAFGAVMDNPELLAIAVVGDGEAETGPLEGSWKGISFLNPARDGTVLPILHLNDAKISGPTVLGRKPAAEVRSLLEGHGYEVLEVTGDDLPGMHHRFAEALATAYDRIAEIRTARGRWRMATQRPRWPMIVLRSPKGWTGPDDGRRNQGVGNLAVPSGAAVRRTRQPRASARSWSSGCGPTDRRSCSTRPVLRSPLVDAANPVGDLRMSATPHANGGLLTRDLDLPDFRDYAVTLTRPGTAVRVDPPAGRDDRRDLPPESRHLPAVLPRRDQQQPARRGLRRSPTARSWNESTPTTSPSRRRSGHGSTERTQLSWLARGLHADRSARLVRHLRGFRDGERVTDDPAQQVAGGGERVCPGGPRCPASTSC